LSSLLVFIVNRLPVLQRILNGNGDLAGYLFEEEDVVSLVWPRRPLQGCQHAYHAVSAGQGKIAPRHQAFCHYALIDTLTDLVAVAFGIVAYFFKVIKVLGLAGPECLAANRTMNGDNGPVAKGPPRLRVVQRGYAQLPTIGVRQ